MKRSPTTSSCSSSSSCIGSDIPHQSVKLKPKRARKTHNPDKCLQIAAAAAGGGGRRSSIYRGVTRSIFLAFSLMGFRLHVRYSCLIIISRHRWTGRFEAHLWDKSSWNNIQNKKGRQGNFRMIFSSSFFYEKYFYNWDNQGDLCNPFFNIILLTITNLFYSSSLFSDSVFIPDNPSHCNVHLHFCRCLVYLGKSQSLFLF